MATSWCRSRARPRSTGGFGIDDKWLSEGRTGGAWREPNLRFTGPAVRQLQAAFAATWTEATGELPSGSASGMWLSPSEERICSRDSCDTERAPEVGPERATGAGITAGARRGRASNPVTDSRAGDRTRTGDVQLGKLAFYQLNYAREPLAACAKSHRSGLNRRPLDYESSALPLSYGGDPNHALARTRTATPCGTTPSRWRVYQFHHQGKGVATVPRRTAARPPRLSISSCERG